MFRLQHETPHNYQTNNNLKGGFCFALRWKDLAVCEDGEALKEYAEQLTGNITLRIVDSAENVIWRTA